MDHHREYRLDSHGQITYSKGVEYTIQSLNIVERRTCGPRKFCTHEKDKGIKETIYLK